MVFCKLCPHRKLRKHYCTIQPEAIECWQHAGGGKEEGEEGAGQEAPGPGEGGGHGKERGILIPLSIYNISDTLQ